MSEIPLQGGTTPAPASTTPVPESGEHDAGHAPDAGPQADATRDGDAVPRDDAGQSKSEDPEYKNVWETQGDHGESASKARPWRQRKAEAASLLADVPAKYAGMITAYDDRLRQLETAVGGISKDSSVIRESTRTQHEQVVNAMATEQASIRDFIKKEIMQAMESVRTMVRNEVAGEKIVITDRIVEILAKRDKDRDEILAERDASIEKKLDETYKMLQYYGGAINGVKDEVESRTKSISKAVKGLSVDVEKQYNTAFEQISKLSDQTKDFEKNMAKFLNENFAGLTAQISSVHDGLTMEGISHRDHVEGTINERAEAIISRLEPPARDDASGPTYVTDTPQRRASEAVQPPQEPRSVWEKMGELREDPITAYMARGDVIRQQVPAATGRQTPPHMIAQGSRGPGVQQPVVAPQPIIAPAPVVPAQQQIVIPQGYQLVPMQQPAQARPERVKFKDAKHFAGKDDEDVDLWLAEVTNELRFGGRSDQEIVDGLPILLEGEAKRWLNRLSLAQRAAIQGWSTPGGWQDVLRQNFRRANYESVMRQKLTQLRWTESQKFTEYFEERSKLQTICCAGYDDAALIEDMLSGMDAADQGQARKEAGQGVTLLEWKRRMLDIEPTIRERRDILKQMKDMEKRLGQMTKSPTPARRSTNWTPRFAGRRPDGTTPEQGDQGKRVQATPQKPGDEKAGYQRPPYQRPQRPNDGQQSNYQPRAARTQVADAEATIEEEQDADEFVNDPYDEEAEADFVDCLMSETTHASEGRRSSRIAKQRDERVQAQARASELRDAGAGEPGSGTSRPGARDVASGDSERGKEPLPEEPSYLNKSPAYIAARFAEDRSSSTFKVCADTGSSITLMDKGLVQRYFSHIAPRTERVIHVKGVGGQTAISQSITLHMQLTSVSDETTSIQAKFYVNPADDMRVILGNDFMEFYGASIDVAKQLMILTQRVGSTTKIELSTRRERVPALKVAEAFSLKPYHRARIAARVSGNIRTAAFYIDPIPLQNGLVAVSARRGIGRSEDRTVQVEVYNLEPWPYRFAQGETIANLLPLEDSVADSTEANVCEEGPRLSGKALRQDLEQFKTALAELDINPRLSEDEKRRITAVLIEHRHAFAYGDRKLGHTNLGKVRIDTGDAAPVSTPPFRVSPEGRKFIEQEIVNLLANDVIEEADSPWAANIVLIKQKTKIRFCVDYRKLNAVTKTDQYPLPRIDDYLNQFQGKRYFSTFDANSGFNQVEIDERDREKTAFRTHVGLYQYKRMPFGIKNGPSIFQRCMDKALGTTKWEFAVVYIDDIVVYSADFETHLKHVATILGRIIPTGFTLSLSKSHICYEEIHALGHKVSQLGIGMKGENVKAILAYPRPRSTKQIQVFLGMAGYYRRFIKDFASIARPLTRLLAKDQTFVWSEECEQAFQTLRSRLAEEPILAHPDYSKEFFVHTDASALGLGGVLAQKDSQGREHIVCAISKALEERERRLSATELECLALVWAMRQFRPYIDGVKSIHIITDHSALQWIYDYKGTNRKLQRWSLELQPWRDIAKIIHRPGRNHSNVDALSRAPESVTPDISGEERDTGAHAQTLTVSALQPDSNMLKSIRQGYLTDQFFASILENLESHARRGIKTSGTLSAFELHDGVIYRRTSDGHGLAMCIPRHKSLRSDMLHDFHDAESAGHMGWEKTFNSLSRLYYWPKLRRDVKTYVGSCDKCQKNKYANRPPAGLLQPLQVVTERWHTVTMDFAGPFVRSPAGNDTVLLVVDKCTKRVHFIPTKQTASASNTAQLFIVNVVRHHGLPRVVISDRDRRFTSNFWSALMEKLGVKTAMSTANHPQTDGQSEAAVKILKTFLRQYINYRQDNWEDLLPLAEIAYNNSVNAITGYSPFELDTGYSARMPHDMINATDRSGVREVDDLLQSIAEKTTDAAHSVREAQRRQAEQHDSGRPEYHFQVDDLVLLSTKHITPPWAKKQKVRKLRPLWIGPYRITDIVNVNSYGLELPADMKIHSTINVEYLKPYVSSPDEWASRTDYGLPVHEENGVEYFAPEAILDREQRGPAARTWYLVKWKGRSIEQASWRPETELQAAVPRMLADFEAQRA